jgi:hypothetical protein
MESEGRNFGWRSKGRDRGVLTLSAVMCFSAG